MDDSTTTPQTKSTIRWNDPRMLKDLGTSVAATVLRGGLGGFSRARDDQPRRRPVLFAKENCPYSRRVREVLTYLDLDYTMVPCPEGATHNRAKLENLIGEQKVPVLADSEHHEILDESGRIERYLLRSYDGDYRPWFFGMPRVRVELSKLASSLREVEEVDDARAQEPLSEGTLELWDFEASPAGRLVRERLDELAITHIRHNTAPGGHRWRRARDKLELLVPVLKEPETGQKIHGTLEILAFLDSYA